MFRLTSQERLVLILLAAVVFLGTLLNLVLKNSFPLRVTLSIMDSRTIYHQVDLNKASQEELVNIPYIGPYTAQRIIEYRREKGLFTSLDQVKLVKGIKEKNYQKFSPFLKISKKP